MLWVLLAPRVGHKLGAHVGQVVKQAPSQLHELGEV